MRIVTSTRLLTPACLAAALGYCSQTSAGAGIYDEGPDSCQTVNCNATPIKGTYILDSANNALPFSVQVYTAGNECVRVDVVDAPVDLEAVLVCPNGQVWRNDDRFPGGDNRPLIVALGAARGWCTLLLSHWSGEGQNVDFVARYGRYSYNNWANCRSPLAPTGAEDRDESSFKTETFRDGSRSTTQ